MESFPHGEDIVDLVADGFIEVDDGLVCGSDLQIDFGYAEVVEKLFDFLHECACVSLALVIGVDGEVVDPATVTIVAGHDGGNDLVIEFADEEPFGLDFEVAVDVFKGIVPGASEFARFPEGDELLLVVGLVGADLHGERIRVVINRFLFDHPCVVVVVRGCRWSRLRSGTSR